MKLRERTEMHARWNLGSVIRNYDDPKHYRWHPSVPVPQHRRDDHLAHMRPDENDTLLVLADCMTHFVRQQRSDLFSGVAASCPRGCSQ